MLAVNCAGMLAVDCAGILAVDCAGMLAVDCAGVLAVDCAGKLAVSCAGVLAASCAGMLAVSCADMLAVSCAEMLAIARECWRSNAREFWRSFAVRECSRLIARESASEVHYSSCISGWRPRQLLYRRRGLLNGAARDFAAVGSQSACRGSGTSARGRPCSLVQLLRSPVQPNGLVPPSPLRADRTSAAHRTASAAHRAAIRSAAILGQPGYLKANVS